MKAEYQGWLEFKTNPSEETIKVLSEMGDVEVMKPNPNNKSVHKNWVIGVKGSGNFDELELCDTFEKLSENIATGEVSFFGENNSFWNYDFFRNGKCTFWKFSYENGKWEEVSNELVCQKKTVSNKPPKVFVYKEYDDTEAYGEEIIKVFATLPLAEEHFKQRVSWFFRDPFEEVINKSRNDEDATVYKPGELPYLSVYNGWETFYFIVEEHEVQTVNSQEEN